MKVLCIVVALWAVFTINLDCASGYAHYKREASPIADPDPEAEPGVAKYVGNFCNTSMEGAKSSKQFCKVVSDKIVNKVNGICEKSVKILCKFFIGKKKQKCKAWLREHMCPAVESGTTAAPTETPIENKKE